MATREETLEALLSEGLDLCVRARQMDAMDRRRANLDASMDAEAWQADGTFDRYVERNNKERPDRPISARSMTIPLWLHDQYQTDLVDWERRARAFLTPFAPPPKIA